ncbi:ABC transporter ATP-binding protein [Arcobacter cryaerophilus gv. pseudocryaerophilus]|uniref:ABC transporter ATP-binding protein n=3 Tax=Arcobacteraceae TaxID=2808963 RepID=A0AA96DV33_9BACT|nr:ABC transporter ATP-binding protein [Aliarcobacter cryaerophilus]WNL34760.1 ABC transporter ATP-binding protein [Arcobacter sp. AZ-2023]WPD11476.1 ABC transporter ATP-binding protein [Arcobacter sp. DSM 115960]MCT7499363.1 ABC transporter ATP-binding protein [Aliarcobacter cryaerophilus]MCT7543211.1 ABC transporter ATP-binding protein [Aliarcobacter cryaerophilus]WNL35760.1 ABC transporter ATP-binding protein [Arcobacter sp. AZ-2023]
MIKVKNLTHYYNNDKALENINLEINKGEFICLVGESGSGKSTLLSIISTLLKPTKGELFFENLNYKNIKDIDDFRKTNIGFIFQFHYLINYLTVKENIKLANEKATDNEIHNLLKILRIENLSNKYPNEISGGQRQRVAIARALINKPKVIIADEPTGNLDSKNSLNVFEILKKLSQEQVTIIVATHDKNLAQIANKIYEVKDGKIN